MTELTARALTAQLKLAASRLGFTLAGACPAVSPPGVSRLESWLEAGFAGEMRYFEERREAYQHPRFVLDGARGMLLLGLPYRTAGRQSVLAGHGRVSCYAWGQEDYHDVIHRRLGTLCELARQLQPGVRARGVVDTAPLLEREFAQLAGLGWIGKNTLLLDRGAGSWFFLAALLLDCELEYDTPTSVNHCGTCRACLDACPTGAFPEPYVLDATRCISYLTIELRGPIPRALRTEMGDWVFGCDVCQDVCPWNRRAARGDGAFDPQEWLNGLALEPLFDWDDDRFRQMFRRTPLWRARRRGLLRNAAIALGNHPSPDAIVPLGRGLQDPEPLVRGACAWALGQLGGRESRDLLQARSAVESDESVRQEIDEALEQGV